MTRLAGLTVCTDFFEGGQIQEEEEEEEDAESLVRFLFCTFSSNVLVGISWCSLTCFTKEMGDVRAYRIVVVELDMMDP